MRESPNVLMKLHLNHSASKSRARRYVLVVEVADIKKRCLRHPRAVFGAIVRRIAALPVLTSQTA